MIFTVYWKVLVLNFLEMGNTVFFRAKKLIERWFLLIIENFVFWTFRWWEIRSFFQGKSCWKYDINLVFLSFPWYFRTWEIWFFVQWLKVNCLVSIIHFLGLFIACNSFQSPITVYCFAWAFLLCDSRSRYWILIQ